MKRKYIGLGLISGMLVAVLFNNCSPEHAGNSNDQFSVLNEVVFNACAFSDEMDLFAKTYHPFLNSRCSNCHIEGGEGKGTFASSGLLVAYNAFSVVGYEMVSEFATNPGHKPPYTGTDNQPQIDLLKQQWVKGLENILECKSGGTPVDPNPVDETTRLLTKSIGINAPTNGTVTITWDLNADILDKGTPLPVVPGAQLSLRVRRYNLGPKPIYEISLPSVKGSTGTDFRIQSLLVALNGKIVPNQTTFRYIDEGIYQGSDVVLAPGSMVVDGPISETDVIAISIGKLETTILPPPPVLPTVSFQLTNQNVVENGMATVNLVLSAAHSQYVSATVGILTTGANLAANRRSQRINFNNMPKEVDRWDWDYSVDTLAVVFAPGETVKPISIRVANDERDEPNENVPLTITSVVNAKKSATAANAIVTITDDDAPYTGTAPTRTQLMQTTGILFQNCMECHNSDDNRGGYNLSDYDLMISTGVLVPGDVSSKMFVRMNSEVSGIRPMPLNGLLDSTLRRQVERWILDGARNN